MNVTHLLVKTDTPEDFVETDHVILANQSALSRWRLLTKHLAERWLCRPRSMEESTAKSAWNRWLLAGYRARAIPSSTKLLIAFDKKAPFATRRHTSPDPIARSVSNNRTNMKSDPLAQLELTRGSVHGFSTSKMSTSDILNGTQRRDTGNGLPFFLLGDKPRSYSSVFQR